MQRLIGLGDRRSRHPAELCQRCRGMGGHDKMIEKADIDQLQGVLDAGGQMDVGIAGLRRTGRMVMRDDGRPSIMCECALHDLARVDERLVDSAFK